MIDYDKIREIRDELKTIHQGTKTTHALIKLCEVLLEDESFKSKHSGIFREFSKMSELEEAIIAQKRGRNLRLDENIP